MIRELSVDQLAYLALLLGQNSTDPGGASSGDPRDVAGGKAEVGQYPRSTPDTGETLDCSAPAISTSSSRPDGPKPPGNEAVSPRQSQGPGLPWPKWRQHGTSGEVWSSSIVGDVWGWLAERERP